MIKETKVNSRKLHMVVLCIIFVVLSACTNSIKENENKVKEKKDENKTTVQDENRIIPTTVAVAHILDALNLDAVAIPTTIYDLPKRYEGLPEVGSPMSPDMEIVKSLNPTEVFSVTTLEADLKKTFDEVGINASYVNLQSIDSMKAAILEIGEKYKRTEEAMKLVTELEGKITAISMKAELNESPKVLILLGIPGSYLVATENSYIGDLVRLAGGQNVMSGQEPEYLPSNTEFLQQSNPDIIIRLAHGLPEQVVEMFNEEFTTNDIWKHFDAVKNGRVYDLDEPLFGTTATLAVPQALEELINIMYP
ncbi:MAG TPA: heme ABC transporter substrate-binding protein IsdE [Lysinibacillus sp.]|uniref:High-affinity heme uptake system protein IsdE n=1 Tax=Lysinibacillus fusiformis TaxID=28031 RepID=A0A2I0V3X2_9BACI|nr:MULTISPECIES: heme ABC transporter substrate-binding protein IsdE [Lysinibacillus]PKU52986.1 heme ABC transporter substrate-binding protein IsdE [Lysinibacillus fusiformis]WCH49063.1 heme ABC transporter substrate-binding protein IsdE [Lysinibacillus sp. OF-1]HBT71334.1 heme ABC transporter substrate-binding protein IsdE [Lysinibacillus sp.]